MGNIQLATTANVSAAFAFVVTSASSGSFLLRTEPMLRKSSVSEMHRNQKSSKLYDAQLQMSLFVVFVLATEKFMTVSVTLYTISGNIAVRDDCLESRPINQP